MDNLNKMTSLGIKELKSTLPEQIMDRHFKIRPNLRASYKERHIRLYLEDTGYHLNYLAESIAANEPILFNEYLSWAKTFFSTLLIDLNDIILNLELIRDALQIDLEPQAGELAAKYLNEGIEKFKAQSAVLPTFILESNPFKNIANNYLSFLIDGNKKGAHDIIMKAFQDGILIRDLYLNVFQVTQQETGRLWQMGKINVGQEHFITSATQLIMSQLYPYMFVRTVKNKKVIVSCITGELHEIGPRMVADLFEMDGWNSYYFGANTPQNSLMKAIEVYHPDLLAISVTMTYNLSAVSDLIETIRNNKETDYLKILVGGYPFNLADKLWNNVGADGTADNAVGAIELASKLIEQ
jgi:methanogenic corrinoid protein MtbC1